MSAAATATAHRLTAATALHRGDRAYQQDQVEILAHGKVPGCVLAVLADGMGGKSGGRKASDQVVMTARQIFERYLPAKDDPAETLKQLVMESHLMIKLTAITAEEEPHSTVAAFLLGPTLDCTIAHAGDSRVYHFRGAEMVSRTTDHSYVQRLIDEGKLSEEQANAHPQANLLTGCLGTQGTISTCMSTAQLVGTGFDVPQAGSCDNNSLSGGGTGWLQTSGNVNGNEIITLRIAIWDTSDARLDSLVVLDNFQWSVDVSDPGTVIGREYQASATPLGRAMFGN